MRGGWFESNLLTWLGRPKHTHGNRVHTQHFPFLSSLWIRVTPFDYKSPTPRSTPGRDHACTRMWPHEKQRSKRVKVKCTCRANQVLMLTDYHISRHVVSMFKRLTTTTTHCGLSTLSLNRWGPMILPWALWLKYVIKQADPIISRVAENYSIFTGPCY